MGWFNRLPQRNGWMSSASVRSSPKKKILHPNKGHVERLHETSLCSNFQRNGDRAKYNLGIRGRLGSEVAGQGQAAVSVDGRKSRVNVPLVAFAAGHSKVPAVLFF